MSIIHKKLPAGHQPKRRMGQNFLVDGGVIQRMLATIHAQSNEWILEIGPGLGALTQGLAAIAQRLDLIELDRDLATHLQKNFADFPNVHVHQSDILQFYLTQLDPIAKCQTNPRQSLIRVVGNLPYNISTPLLFHLFAQREWIVDMHFLLQKEVVDRICAAVGGSDYGRLSVMCQYYCTAEPCFDVPPQCFNPAPQVQSTFVRMTPRQQPLSVASDFQHFSELVRDLFNHRRQTIGRYFRAKQALPILEKLEIDAKRRPQELSVATFVALSNAMNGIECPTRI